MNEQEPRHATDGDPSQALAGGPRRGTAEAASVVQIRHRWERIAVGRVCAHCRTAQATGEFDDDVDCEPKAS
jgi:hypothetical protein